MRKIVKVKKKTVSPIAVIKGAVTKMKIAVKKRQILKEIAVGKTVNTVSQTVEKKTKKVFIMKRAVTKAVRQILREKKMKKKLRQVTVMKK